MNEDELDRGLAQNETLKSGGSYTVKGGNGNNDYKRTPSLGSAGSDYPNDGAANDGCSSTVRERICSLSASKYVHCRARLDMKMMEEHGAVSKRRKSRKVFDDETLKNTLRFIFMSANMQLMAWGTRRIKINGEYKIFTLMMREISNEAMWRRYAMDSVVFPDGVSKVKRTVFIDIVRTLMKANISQLACIDYKLHALVYENSCTLQRIIEEQVRRTEERRILKKKLEGVIE